MGGERLWPDVTSPLARQVLAGAFETVPFKQSLSRKTDYLPAAAPGILEYRADLRRRLQKSGLAQALVAGQDLLPNIYEVLPQPLRMWELLWKPRNFKQLAHLIVRYLDWYVEPRPHISSDLTKPRLLTMWTIIGALAVLAFGPILGLYEQSGAINVGWVAGGLVLAFLVFVTMFGRSYLNSGRHRAALIDMNAVRVAEFLFYLIDSYSDATQAEDAKAPNILDEILAADVMAELKLKHVMDRPLSERE